MRRGLLETDKNLSSSSKNATAVPTKERAIVLQGGGALGAYEAGAYKLCTSFFRRKIKQKELKEYPSLTLLQVLR